jgi:hypothetical protein
VARRPQRAHDLGEVRRVRVDRAMEVDADPHFDLGRLYRERWRRFVELRLATIAVVELRSTKRSIKSAARSPTPTPITGAAQFWKTASKRRFAVKPASLLANTSALSDCSGAETSAGSAGPKRILRVTPPRSLAKDTSTRQQYHP